MTHKYSLDSVCGIMFEFNVDENRNLYNVKLVGGCPGYSQAVAKLLEEMNVHIAINKLGGIKCQGGTSCANEIARCLNNCISNEKQYI